MEAAPLIALVGMALVGMGVALDFARVKTEEIEKRLDKIEAVLEIGEDE
jgi:hypothetical protein